MKITTIDIDWAKEIFQIHGVDAHCKAVLRKQLRRSKMVKFFANLEPCLIGMEACGSSHHWARKLSEFGHTVKLMSPQFVNCYIANKNVLVMSYYKRFEGEKLLPIARAIMT